MKSLCTFHFQSEYLSYPNSDSLAITAVGFSYYEPTYLEPMGLADCEAQGVKSPSLKAGAAGEGRGDLSATCRLST